MSWPPADTDRNRLVYTLVAVLGALATVYFLLWALQTRGAVPWAGFTLLLAATLVAALGLLSMLERRRAAPRDPAGPAGPAGPAAGDDPAGADRSTGANVEGAAPAADPQA